MTDEKLISLIRQVEAKGIASERVLNAMLSIDRAKFVPEQYRHSAYIDSPLPIGSGQTISQPYIVAYMTEQLGICPEDRVLEVGAGSGYQLAILTELSRNVYSIEKRKRLIAIAQKNLLEAGCSIPPIKAGDGYEGWEDHAPFDKIIVTAAATHIPPPLVSQLGSGGRMVIPVGGRDEVQRLLLVLKDENGAVATRSLESVRFVPMVGKAQKKK